MLALLSRVLFVVVPRTFQSSSPSSRRLHTETDQSESLEKIICHNDVSFGDESACSPTRLVFGFLQLRRDIVVICEGHRFPHNRGLVPQVTLDVYSGD